MMQLRPHQQRALDAMLANGKGQVYCPTGGGKTYIMIAHALQHIAKATSPQTIVVVAPRILLANQLHSEFSEFLTDAKVMHVHSGETVEFHSTKPHDISSWVVYQQGGGYHTLVFTTYHSLPKVIDAGIHVDVAYFDEAHNATGKAHFEGVFAMSQHADACYYFTATPRVHRGSAYQRGMNNLDVYGPVLCNVPAPELIEAGAIVPPQIVPFETDLVRMKENAHEVDANNLLGILDSLDDTQNAKVLVAAPNTKVLWRMLSQTAILKEVTDRGYEVLHITSKHGAYVNDQKVSREVFFKTLSSYGSNPTKKFLVFHYSILSEGINCPGLTHTILLRNLPIIEMAQTIGRVIRVDSEDRANVEAGKYPAGAFSFYKKPCGFVTVPLTQKYGAAIAKRLQRVVDSIFIEGVPPAVFI